MTGKEYLFQLIKIDEYINALLAEKQTAFDEATHITPMLKGDVRVQTTDKNSQEQKMIRVCEYDLMIDREIDRLVDLKREAMEILQDMGCQLHKTILIYRFFRNMPMEKIAETLGYERTSVFRHYAEALNEFEENMQHFATVCNTDKG